VLDAGCGGGWYSEQLIDRGARVVAIDRSARMVALAGKRLAGRARVIHADIVNLRGTFADTSFDLILSSLLLHYVTDLLAAFAECVRVLRPRLPAPEGAESSTMPSYNRLRSHDCHRIKNGRREPI
jgi:SAM-dependent methyltransferase